MGSGGSDLEDQVWRIRSGSILQQSDSLPSVKHVMRCSARCTDSALAHRTSDTALTTLLHSVKHEGGYLTPGLRAPTWSRGAGSGRRRAPPGSLAPVLPGEGTSGGGGSPAAARLRAQEHGAWPTALTQLRELEKFWLQLLVSDNFWTGSGSFCLSCSESQLRAQDELRTRARYPSMRARQDSELQADTPARRVRERRGMMLRKQALAELKGTLQTI